MAKYDRRILLPYLRNLCSTELLILMQQKEMSALRASLEELEQLKERDIPPDEVLPASPGPAIAFGCLALAFGAVAVISGVLAFDADIFWLLTFSSALICLACAASWWYCRKQYLRRKNQYLQYCRTLEKYHSHAADRQALAEEIAQHRTQITALAEQINECISLKRSLYGLNVIPGQNRNLSTVQYLYEFFRTSKADDIDTVLQICAVEEMKDHLGHITKNQADLLLAQRTRIADQVTSDPIQRQYYEEQMTQIAAQEPNPELRSQYIKMLHEDLNESQFFAQYALRQMEYPL